MWARNVSMVLKSFPHLSQVTLLLGKCMRMCFWNMVRFLQHKYISLVLASCGRISITTVVPGYFTHVRVLLQTLQTYVRGQEVCCSAKCSNRCWREACNTQHGYNVGLLREGLVATVSAGVTLMTPHCLHLYLVVCDLRWPRRDTAVGRNWWHSGHSSARGAGR